MVTLLFESHKLRHNILLPLIITKDNNENAKTIYGIQRTQGIQRIQEWIK